MTVALLIVNWNGGDLLRRCLESVRDQRRPPDHVIVVDNASTDDSIARAEPQLGSVEVIKLHTNTGFAHANNVGARAARTFDALALMNPDVVADPGWLEALVAAAGADPRAAGFASRMLMASAPRLDGAGDSYHVSGRAWRRGHGMEATAGPQENVDTFGPCAAAALYRRDAFEEVGGFDERFFCYFEDVDLAFRLRLRGYTCRYRAMRPSSTTWCRRSAGIAATSPLSRRAQRDLDVREEHARSVAVDVPSPAHRLECAGPPHVSVARTGHRGVEGQARRPARSLCRAQAGGPPFSGTAGVSPWVLRRAFHPRLFRSVLRTISLRRIGFRTSLARYTER
jgi:hypothetical protein